MTYINRFVGNALQAQSLYFLMFFFFHITHHHLLSPVLLYHMLSKRAIMYPLRDLIYLVNLAILSHLMRFSLVFKPSYSTNRHNKRVYDFRLLNPQLIHLCPIYIIAFLVTSHPF